jgi:tRNA threonylcarbamoyladenosine biosynthesis protein TsaB
LKILALDTSTEACSVALVIEQSVSERTVSGQQHSASVLGLIDELLIEAALRLSDLDAIAFGRGPGLFTGLRIGSGVVQGLAFGAGLPVVPVSSLAALAQAEQEPRVLAAIDARMSQVYWAAYVRTAAGTVEPVGAESVLAPQDVPVPASVGWVGVGSGWDQYEQALRRRVGSTLLAWRARRYPQARHVAELGLIGLRHGQAVAPEQALPVYLRDEVAHLPR